MSLRDAIAEIADDIEHELKACEASGSFVTHKEVRSWVKQLRRALKASEGEKQTVTPQQVGPLNPLLYSPSMAQGQHLLGVEAAKLEFRNKKQAEDQAPQKATVEEKYDGVNVELVGGEMDGTFTPIPPDTRLGSHTTIFGEVYTLTRGDDGVHRLVFNPDLTAKVRESER